MNPSVYYIMTKGGISENRKNGLTFKKKKKRYLMFINAIGSNKNNSWNPGKVIDKCQHTFSKEKHSENWK